MSALDFVSERLATALGRAPTPGEDHVIVKIERRAEVATVLRIGRETEAVVGVRRGAIRLDLSPLRGLHVDDTSLLVTVETGWPLQALEIELGRRGLQLGPLPATSLERSVGAWLSAPRGSEAMPRVGPVAQLVYRVDALLADGSELQTKGAPRKAAGPELWQLLVGTRGALGVLLAATLRVERRAESRREAAWEFADPRAAIAAARAILLDGTRPYEVTLHAPALLTATFEAPTLLCEAQQRHANQLATRLGGRPVPHQPPARYRNTPSERTVPLDRLHTLAPLPKEARLVGWHLGGATLVDPARPYTPPLPSPIVAALKRRLDPSSYLPELQ